MNEAIKALVELEAELEKLVVPMSNEEAVTINGGMLFTILDAIEALKPIAEGTHVVMPREPSKDLQWIGFDDPECTGCGGTGIDYQTEQRCACQSPASGKRAREAAEGVEERVAQAIYATKGHCYADDERMFQPCPWDDADEIIQEGCRTEARAALAAIKEVK